MFLNNEITLLRNTEALYRGEQMKMQFAAQVKKIQHKLLALAPNQIHIGIDTLEMNHLFIPLRSCLESLANGLSH